MMKTIWLATSAVLLAAAQALAAPAEPPGERDGAAAMGDWRSDSPGVVRKLTAGDLPAAFASRSAASPAGVVARPAGASLKTLPGFTVAPFAKLDHPRQIRVAPNGDVFVAETDAGRITVLRAADGASAPAATSVYASGLDHPFGIAFFPPGPKPRYVYVANNNSVERFDYQSGDLKARSAPQAIVAKISPTSGWHTTRDVDFTVDGKRMLVSVGSGSNVAEGMPPKSAADIKAWEASRLTGAAWGRETDRADLLSYDPDGGHQTTFATGVRNCVSLRVHPVTGEAWCAVNERDILGDDVPPDYVSRIKAGGFYGWPWYYIGDHEDPRLKGQRPDLAGKAIVPDVLIQPHSAALGLTFYTAKSGASAYPAAYRGDAFVALHGSWNRAKRTGYKIVRLKLKNGIPTGSYEDFVTGFVVDDSTVWGRPVGVALAHDGALLFTDDGGSEVWRVAYDAKLAAATGGAKAAGR